MFINRDATPTVSIKAPRSIGYEWCMHAKQTNSQTHTNTHGHATKHTHTHTHTYTHPPSACAHTHTRARERSLTHAHAHPRAHTHKHTHTHTQEPPIGDACAKAMGAPIGRVGSEKIGKVTARLMFAQPHCYIELTTALRNQEPPVLADASVLPNPGADVGVSRCRCGRVPAQVRASPVQMWAHSQNRCGRSPGADVGPAIGKAVASPGADVGKQRLSAAQALAHCGCVRECARVRALLRWYGFHSILIWNLLRCCLCACAHTCPAVHACPEVHMCVRVRALGRPRVHVARAIDVA